MEISFIVNNKSYLLSQAFISEIQSTTSYVIIRNAGEGSFNVALLVYCKKSKKNYILLASKNPECEPGITHPVGVKLIKDLQDEKQLNDNIIKIHEYFTLTGIELSDDKEYCPNLKTHIILIQVVDYISGISLDRKIFMMSKENTNTKMDFLLKLRDKLTELLKYIKSKDLYYSDFSTTNFMLRDRTDINTLTFIDIESFSPRKKELPDSHVVYEVVYMLRWILTPLSEDVSEITDYNTLKQITTAKLFTKEELSEVFGFILMGYTSKQKSSVEEEDHYLE